MNGIEFRTFAVVLTGLVCFLVLGVAIAKGHTSATECATPTQAAFAETWSVDYVYVEAAEELSDREDLTAYVVRPWVTNVTDDPIESFPIEHVWLETDDGKHYEGRWDDRVNESRSDVYNPDIGRAVWLRVEVPTTKTIVALVASDGSLRADVVHHTTSIP